MTDETPNLWFVELSGMLSIRGNTSSSVELEHKNSVMRREKEKIEYKEEHSYGSLWNGFPFPLQLLNLEN